MYLQCIYSANFYVFSSEESDEYMETTELLAKYEEETDSEVSKNYKALISCYLLN